MQKRQLRRSELELLMRPTRSSLKQAPQAPTGFDRQRPIADRLGRRETPENEAALLLGKHYYILQPQTADLCNRALDDPKPETIQAALAELKRQGLNAVAEDLKSELKAMGVRNFSVKKIWTKGDAKDMTKFGLFFSLIGAPLTLAGRFVARNTVRLGNGIDDPISEFIARHGNKFAIGMVVFGLYFTFVGVHTLLKKESKRND